MSDSWSKPVTVDEMYGDWDYDAAVAALDRSLSPRPAASIFDVVGSLGVGPSDVVLDIGGREGQHALSMAERFGCRAVSVDPVRENNERGQELVAAHEYGHLGELRLGSIEQIPAEDGSFQLVFSRDSPSRSGTPDTWGAGRPGRFDAVKIDLLLDPFATSWPAMAAMAEAAESVGFDGLWTWDHLAGQVHGEDSVLEGWTVLSAIAAITTEVTIGPLVLNVANRRPGVLAVMAATLQQVSGGRLLLGLGAGGDRETPYWIEQAALGLDVPADGVRRQQVADAVAVCRQVWSGRTEPQELTTQRLEAGAGFLRPEPDPPILLGGFGPRMAELAGSIADGFNTQAGHPRLDRLIEAAHSARDRSPMAGRAFEISGFAGLDPGWVERAAGRLDRLVLIVSPNDSPERVARFARAAGLGGRR